MGLKGMARHCFITIEGGEGSGKTTLIDSLRETLEQQGMSVLVSREPGGVEIAEKIRALILDRQHTHMDARTEALLYAAARRQHLVEKVLPALSAGRVVICDRFIDSSLAYQGHARGIGMDEVLAINEFAIADRMPDLTVLLDLPPEQGLARIHKHQGREINRLDMESLSFHEQVREGYLQLAKRFPERIRLIDARQPTQVVFDQVLKLVQSCLGLC